MFIKKAIALSLIAGSLSMTALAKDNNDVAFKYNPQDSAQGIHAEFLQTAKESCRESVGYPSAISGVYPLAEWACVSRLMDEAVEAVNQPELTQVHKDYIDPAQPYRVAGAN